MPYRTIADISFIAAAPPRFDFLTTNFVQIAEAGKGWIVDDEGAGRRSGRHGRRGRAAPQEADLADRRAGVQEDNGRRAVEGLRIDLDATVGDHVHVP
jgi:hypothetical protein